MLNATAPKRILALHDLSCVGRASLAVITPVLSVLGHQAISLPTLMLSSHTGGLGTPAKLQSVAFCEKALLHYRDLGIDFDTIYTGYLASAEGVALAKKAIELFPSAYKLIDPVMADNGKLYSSVTEEWQTGLKKLCNSADLITPNYTEAHLLLQREIPNSQQPIEYSKELATALLKFAPTVIVTGVVLGDEIATVCAGRENFVLKTARNPKNFPGTGDLLDSVLLGKYLNGNSLFESAITAQNFVKNAIENTKTEDARLGLWFEPLLGNLI